MNTEGFRCHLSPWGWVLTVNSSVVGKQVNALGKNSVTSNSSLLDLIEKETKKVECIGKLLLPNKLSPNFRLKTAHVYDLTIGVLQGLL